MIRPHFFSLAVVAGLLLSGTNALAQTSALLGLPLVTKPGGWGRYVGKTSEGPMEMVIKVGKSERVGKETLQWVALEIGTPANGRLLVEWLIAGKAFGQENIRKMQVTIPGRPPQGAEQETEEADNAKLSQRALGTRELKVGGKALKVTEYVIEARTGRVRVGWSPEVPGLGLVYVDGQDGLVLTAFGQGGDPWKGASENPVWPANGIPPPLPEPVTPAARP